jgi:hypothetical protein
VKKTSNYDLGAKLLFFFYPASDHSKNVQTKMAGQIGSTDLEQQFQSLVDGNTNFNGTTLESFSAVPVQNTDVYFDLKTPAGVTFQGKVLALRKRFETTQFQQGKISIVCFHLLFSLDFCPCLALIFILCSRLICFDGNVHFPCTCLLLQLISTL